LRNFVRFLRFFGRSLLSVVQPGVTIVIRGGVVRGDQSMSRLGWMGALRAGTALGALIIATAQANAGAFALREQSTYGPGTSFAGVAAGGSVSSMFWNPAILTQFPGIMSENGVTGIFGHASHTPQPGSTLAGAPLFYPGVSNSADMGFVVNGYTTYQLAPNL